MKVDLSKVDLAAVANLIVDLFDGVDDDDLDELAGIGDSLIDIGDTPIGEVVETYDGPALRLLLAEIAKAFQKLNDPARIRARAEKAMDKGKVKVAERRFARADRIEARRAAKAD